MSTPLWVSVSTVEALHDGVIEIGGGAHGVRNAALLESALARPQNLHAYAESDIFQLAASYAEGIAPNHAFVDGNKRTAFMVAVIFLDMNGFDLNAAKDVEHAEMMEQLARGKLTREEAAAYFQSKSQAQGI